MPLLERIGDFGLIDTILEMETAADARIEEAVELFTAPRRLESGAQYLLGYAGELLVKAAYFRFIGVPPHQNLEGPRRAAWRVIKGSAWWDDETAHSAYAWARRLVDARLADDRPLPPGLASEFVAGAVTIAANWREDLRYHAHAPTPPEFQETYDSVLWLRSNHAALWR
jgi:hypothetical protein